MSIYAYALAAEDGTIDLMIVTATETQIFKMSNPSDLADTLKRAMAAQREIHMTNAVMVKPQTEGVTIEGWTV